MNDLIFVSMEVWDNVWRRNQFICDQLARRFPKRQILFVGPARNVAQHVRRRQFKALLKPATMALPEYPNITVTRPLRIAPDTYMWGRRINESMARRHIRRAARKLGMKKPLLWLNPHYAHHMPGKMNERGVVYDITDDWELAECLAPLRSRIVREDRELCARADITVVCSQALADRRKGLCRHLLLLPNGVDDDHYEKASRPPPADAPRGWPAPVFGYTGSLHPDRIDGALVARLARSFPLGSVVLVGPGGIGTDNEEALKDLPNVYRPGSVPYAEIPRIMAYFDVCIVPHRQTAFTESLNPIKLWEYLASGKPVVSTNVAGFRDFPELCAIAEEPDAFVTACKTALDDPPELSAARREVAHRNSWTHRVDELLKTLIELKLIEPEAAAMKPDAH